jgi:hypothetical protein
MGALVVGARCVADGHRPSRNWWGFEDHGCKPGTGYVLIEKDGTIIGAHFFIFTPDSPEEGSGRFLQMDNIKQDGRVLIGEVKSFKGTEENSRFRIEFQDAFGEGRRVRAEVTDPDKDRAKQRAQNIVFVLQGDESGSAKEQK